MGNPVFHFKQFSVYQGKTVMKVGTDGVLLGAWAPVDQASTILDVGTGTGLIALMLAQRNPHATITAIDIDKEACEEAAANFKSSPWLSRLTASNVSLQEFLQVSGKKYDLLVSNPPYFSRSMQAPCLRRTHSRHDETLSIADLIQCSKQLLNDRGTLALVLPVDQYEKLGLVAVQQGLYEQRRVLVHPNPGKPVKRILSVWGFTSPDRVEEDNLVIENGVRHQYSDAYIQLTKDFYLNM